MHDILYVHLEKNKSSWDPKVFKVLRKEADKIFKMGIILGWKAPTCYGFVRAFGGIVI